MPLVERNGLAFHVQTLGAGPPLGMLHGLLVGSLAGWYFGAAGRLAKRHQVLLYDARGHGRSARVASGFDLRTLTADLEALLPLAGAGPAVLVGHSYGALTALAFALRHRDRVARLLLVDAPLPPFKLPEVDLSAVAGELPAFARGGRPRARFLEQVRFLGQETTLVADLAAEPGLPEDALAGLRLPLSLLYGDRSSCRPAGERLAEVVPGARLRVVPGGHFLPTECPSLVADWLAGELHG